MTRMLRILLIVSACAIAPTARFVAAAEQATDTTKKEPTTPKPAASVPDESHSGDAKGRGTRQAPAKLAPDSLGPATLVPGATTIYNYGFEPPPGEEPDDWPPGWTRRRGPGFPIYLPVTITHESASEGQYSLRIQLNGGGVEMFSPPLPCSTLANYVFQGTVRVSPLVHDRAWFSLSFIDDQRRVLASFVSEELRDTEGWRKLRIGPCRAANERVRHVVIGLHLESREERRDLTGWAEFDDLWLVQAPRVSIELDDPLHLYTAGQEVTVRSRTLGDESRPTSLSLAVFDAYGKPVDAQLTPLNQDSGESPADSDRPDDKPSGANPGEISKPDDESLDLRQILRKLGVSLGVGGPAWKVRLSEPGFYRLVVTLNYSSGQAQQGETTLVVLPPRELPSRSPFGWSMPYGYGALEEDQLIRLLSEAGVSWVKLPMWAGEDREQVELLAMLARDLRTSGIDLVGVLAEPPKPLLEKLRLSSRASLARTIQAPVEDWLSSVDLLMTRVSWQVRAWQLGADREQSLLAIPDLGERITALKLRLDAVGEDVMLGIPWPWQTPDPKPRGEETKLPWRFVTVSDATLQSPEELDQQLRETRKGELPRWVSLEPVIGQPADTTARVINLVERMVLAVEHKAPFISLHAPIRDSGGICTADGAPGELFLPWRTTAMALGGTRYLGKLPLPGESDNRVFVREGKAVLLLAPREPGEERLFLGDDARRIDVWGRGTKLPRDGNDQVIEVGPLPVFVTGIEEAITRFRMALKLADPQLPSQFGVRHRTSVSITNTFRTAVSGTLRIVAPESWRASPDRIELRMDEGQELQLPLELHVPFNGTTGTQDVRFEFDLLADKRYQFSAYEKVEIGDRYLQMLLKSKLDERGNLLVEQVVRNQSKQAVELKCHLYVPGQRRHRAQVFCAAGGESVFTYALPEGQSLIGQTLWIRAEESAGPRVLSQRFVASP